jgi:hypothetical protein
MVTYWLRWSQTTERKRENLGSAQGRAYPKAHISDELPFTIAAQALLDTIVAYRPGAIFEGEGDGFHRHRLAGEDGVVSHHRDVGPAGVY